MFSCIDEKTFHVILYINQKKHILYENLQPKNLLASTNVTKCNLNQLSWSKYQPKYPKLVILSMFLSKANCST